MHSFINTRMEMNRFHCCKESVTYLVILQSHWFLPLFSNKPKKFDFLHLFLAGRCTQGGHETKMGKGKGERGGGGDNKT